MTRWAVEHWLRNDIFNFKNRINVAHQDYVESLEEDMDEVCANRRGNHDILRIFRLKAEHPEKYREEVTVVGMDASKNMLDKLRELASKDLAQRAALEAPAVEGVYKEVDSPKPDVGQPDVSSRGQMPSQRAEAPLSGPTPWASARDRRMAQVKAGRVVRGKPPGRITRR
jgi:hypothetical protein